MAQMTESLARSLLVDAEKDKHPPITAWEICQLLHFFLAHHERHGYRPAGYAQLNDLPHVRISEATH